MLRIDKENYNLLCSLLIFLICYILLALIAMRPIIAFDTFWHLQMGKDLMEGGLSPWVDHYSFSYPGKEISAIPVFFQILVYQFVSIFGEDEGFYFIKLFYITLLMSALFIYFRKIKANAFIIILLLPIIASAINLRLILRPEIFSNVLIVICLLLYLRAQKTFATKEMVFISLLLLFWVNYHAPIIGYIIIFGLFLDKFINKLVHKDESFSWRQWVFWGGVIFSIGFININAQYLVGQHFVLDTINVMSDDFGKYTQEYKQAYLLYSTDMMVHVSWALSIYVAIWSLIKKQYGFVFITILLTYFSWSLSRLVTVVMLVNMCVLALYFSQVTFSKHLVDIRSSVRKSLSMASNSLILVSTDLRSEVMSATAFPRAVLLVPDLTISRALSGPKASGAFESVFNARFSSLSSSADSLYFPCKTRSLAFARFLFSCSPQPMSKRMQNAKHKAQTSFDFRSFAFDWSPKDRDPFISS